MVPLVLRPFSFLANTTMCNVLSLSMTVTKVLITMNRISYDKIMLPDTILFDYVMSQPVSPQIETKTKIHNITFSAIALQASQFRAGNESWDYTIIYISIRPNRDRKYGRKTVQNGFWT